MSIAVIQTGGKQYKVKPGDIIKIEKIESDNNKISFDKVLMLDDKIGTPYIENVCVNAEILEQKRDDKILVFKKNRRKNYRKTLGHRQYITVAKIIDIK